MTIRLHHNPSANVRLNFGIELFRAKDRVETCLSHLQGHHAVLEKMGIDTKVFSSDPRWLSQEGVWVIQLIDLDNNHIIGGERIHIYNGKDQLPFAKAVQKEAPQVNDLVKNYAIQGTGELCGLWINRDYANMRLTNIMTQFGVAAAKILQLNSLFIFCADYTLGPVELAGFLPVSHIGEQGRFRYPLPSMTATVLQIKKMDSLDLANERFRSTINGLFETPKDKLITAIENFSFNIEYNILPEIGKTFAFKKST